MALVTGSEQGIGRAIALRMAQGGADVIIYDRTIAVSARTAGEAIRQMGRRALLFQGDVTNRDDNRRKNFNSKWQHAHFDLTFPCSGTSVF